VREGAHIIRTHLTVGVSLSKRPTQAYKGNESDTISQVLVREIRFVEGGSIGYGRNRSLRRMCAKEGAYIKNEGTVLGLVGVSLSKRPTQAYKGNENVLPTSSSTHRWMIGSIGKGRNRSLRRICAKAGHLSRDKITYNKLFGNAMDVCD
jgi:16S rRNA U516 pseudouridylate synthase RsuA-like enzyme